MPNQGEDITLLEQQKKQLELALKSQIRIAKSIKMGHQPLSNYHFQKAIEKIKHYRLLSYRSKQSLKDLDLLVDTSYFDSEIIEETASKFKFKLEYSKEFIESKFLVKNFEDMNLQEMSDLFLKVHNRVIVNILPPITSEDIERGLKYLEEKKSRLPGVEIVPEVKKVEEGIIEVANLFSTFLLNLLDEVRKKATNNFLKWEKIVKLELPLEKKSRIAQGLSHLTFQNKLWLINKNKGDYFQIME